MQFGLRSECRVQSNEIAPLFFKQFKNIRSIKGMFALQFPQFLVEADLIDVGRRCLFRLHHAVRQQALHDLQHQVEKGDGLGMVPSYLEFEQFQQIEAVHLLQLGRMDSSVVGEEPVQEGI